MTMPTDPAELQAHILQQLLKTPEEPTKTESKAPAKFAKQVGDLFETRLKDRLHHEIQSEQVALTPVRFLQPAIRQQAPVSVLWDANHTPLAILRYDQIMPAVLSRICFGGDVEASIVASSKPTTEAEFGLLQIVAGMVSKALEETGLATVSATTTMPENQFETDEYEDSEGFKCGFEIRIGQTTCTLDMTIRQSLVFGAQEPGEVDQLSAVGNTNDEMMHTPVLASVRLKPQPTTLGEIRALRVGDCLPLASEDQLHGQFVVSNKEIFDCQIGRSGEAYSLKIARRSDPEARLNHAL